MLDLPEAPDARCSAICWLHSTLCQDLSFEVIYIILWNHRSFYTEFLPGACGSGLTYTDIGLSVDGLEVRDGGLVHSSGELRSGMEPYCCVVKRLASNEAAFMVSGKFLTVD